ncbi:S8 family serine peptidase [Sporosarcina sp. HYO08]|uniref:S8 family peptidase n=1 Tax=Sporosarcina sp. HYO08 TaxID=1759557 RepID=UPI00155F4736|nr:S8 family serine peptidase [Sporosarcina sp. HYO08]
MKKIGMSLYLSILFIFCMQSTTFAEESRADYLLIGENQTEITRYMNEQNIPIGKIYSSFSIISASLTESEYALLQNRFPNLTTQKNQTYKSSKDTTPTSIKAVQAAKEQTLPYTGAGIKVAVLDSGVDVKHRDLKVQGGYCSLGYDCAPGTPYDDDNGHGTHVAGIIAASNNNTGIIGIAPDVELYSIKALNAFGVGSTNSLINGVEWAIKNNIDILNLSITTEDHDVALEKALATAYQKGMLIVGSAGNNGGTANKSVMYPAKYETVIAVSAVKNDLSKLKESAMGKEVDIAAPGELVFSTYPVKFDSLDFKVDGYTHMSGTSMATPHVTGILALYKERFPKKSNVELRALLQSHAKDLGDSGKDPIFGYGLAQYVPNIPGTTVFDVKEEVGLATLATTYKVSSIESGGKKITSENNVWKIYGVGGRKNILVTSVDANGKSLVEQQYIQLKSPMFSDVINAQRFAESIGYLSSRKQINGFEDGTFRPYANITRGEAAALIGRALGYSDEKTTTKFADVSASSFASGYIQKAVDAKIISGYSDGTFRPGNFVTRAEMAILISKAFDLKATTAKTFTDVASSMSAYQAINTLIAAGVTTGYGDGTFKPYDNMTRADFSVFLARVQDDVFK